MRNRLLSSFLLLATLFGGTLYLMAACGDTWQTYSADTVYAPTPDSYSVVPYNITKHWRIFWTDGYERNDAQVIGYGQSRWWHFTGISCPPTFDSPHFITNTATKGEWVQRAYNRIADDRLGRCDTGSPAIQDWYHRHTCNATGGGSCGEPVSQTGTCATGFVDTGGICDRSLVFQASCLGPTYYDPEFCSCPDGVETTPIFVDIDNTGFSLTNALNGVDFDILAETATKQRISWTSTGSSNALLALDRNGNSSIDSGEELFGSITPQPTSTEKQGFKALAVYDAFAQGGNGDGLISANDTIYSQLRLWQDSNHNGFSEPSELKMLSDLGVASIELDYKLSNQIDGNGNKFRYRAKIRNAQGVQNGRWAWDVFLVVQQP